MSMNKTWAISSWISFLISTDILSGALRLHEFHRRLIQTVESASGDIPVIYATDCAPLLSTRQLQIETPSRNRLPARMDSAIGEAHLDCAGTPSSKRPSFQGVDESHYKMLARKRTREFQPRPFCFRIFLPATRSRTARRNFSRSAGLSMSSLSFIASATVLA